MPDNMIPVADHASRLAKLLEHTSDPSIWEQLADSLTVASAIVSVRLDLIRFDEQYGWCKFADEFTSARQQLLQHYVTELTRFTYCWGALDSAIQTLAPPPAPKRGRINDACYYIQRHSADDNGVCYYWDTLGDFRQALADSEELDILPRFRPPPFVSRRSLALYVIYPVRNRFAHGTLTFPLPDADNRPRAPHVTLVQLASRLTLMSIQHLLAAAHQTHLHTWEAVEDGEDIEHEFHAFLRSLHVRRPSHSNNLRLL